MKLSKTKVLLTLAVLILLCVIVYVYFHLVNSTGNKEKLKDNHQASRFEEAADSNDKTSTNTSVDKSENSYGNTSANILNGGTVISDGNWMYIAAENGIYKINKNNRSTKHTIVSLGTSSYASDLNLEGEYLYFASSDSSFNVNISRVKLDGSDLTVIAFGVNPVPNLNIYNHKLYYINKEGNIVTAKIDGTNPKILNKQQCQDMNVTGKWIYYINNSDKVPYSYIDEVSQESRTEEIGRIYKMSLDGSKIERVSNDGACFLMADDKYIYYSNAADGVPVASEGDSWLSGKLYRINTANYTKEKLSEWSCTQINKSKDWVYFNCFAPRGIFRLNITSGKVQAVIESTYCGGMNLVDNELFYFNIIISEQDKNYEFVYYTSEPFGLYSLTPDKVAYTYTPKPIVNEPQQPPVNIEDGYIIPYSNSRKLQESDISGFTKEQLAFARNEIYARHGYIFKMQIYKTYFEQKSWYMPNPYFSESDLSEIEIYNVEFIKQHET